MTHELSASARHLPENLPTGLLVGGAWRGAHDTFPVVDPATGSLLAEVGDATVQDGLDALAAAAAAGPQWAATPARERAELLRALFDAVMARAEDFAALVTAELGKPLRESRAEVAYGAEFLRWFAEEAPRVAGRYGANPEASAHVVVSKRPVGPCLLVTPWNFPLAMATRKIAPALAAGCTVVVKPAEDTPLTTLLLARVAEEVGLPAGVLNVVTTSDPGPLCAAVMADPRLRKLSFTGSTEVGRVLLRQAAQGVLRTSMELGGNAPFLVFDDADLDVTLDAAMVAKFRNAGQTCVAANRFLVHASVAPELTRRLVERVAALRVGAGEGDDIGPLVDREAVSRVEGLVEDAVRRGARLAHRGHAPSDRYCAPAVLVDVPAGARVVREEIFGPVVAVQTFIDEDDAIRRANDTSAGLVAYACTRDRARTLRLVDALDVGMIGIDTGLVSNAAAPFGGWKESGIGREGGVEGIEEYLATTYTAM